MLLLREDARAERPYLLGVTALRVAALIGKTVVGWTYKKALCHNEQTATLLFNFGFGHVLQYTPFILNLSALHFTHSYTRDFTTKLVAVAAKIGVALVPRAVAPHIRRF